MSGDLFLTENEFVQWLQLLAAPARGHERARSSRLEKGVNLGIGDDAALLAVKRGHELILTTDMSIEGVHFTRRLHPAEAVGHRALARSLSDVAAMGGVPRYVLVSLAISKQIRRLGFRVLPWNAGAGASLRRSIGRRGYRLGSRKDFH
jgi:hypothetical protein